MGHEIVVSGQGGVGLLARAAASFPPSLQLHVRLAGMASPSPLLRDLLGVRARPAGITCIGVPQAMLGETGSALRAWVSGVRDAGLMLGVVLAGAGGGSLDALASFEPDFIRIGERHVAGIATDREVRRRTCSLIAATSGLGAEFIAEGIGSRAELHVLRAMGVRFGQGIYWSRSRPQQASPRREAA